MIGGNDCSPHAPYREYLKSGQTFEELIQTLSVLPSPKKEYFNSLVCKLKIKPSYLRMVLCPTSSGKELGKLKRKIVSEYLEVDENILFPRNKMSNQSLIGIYMQLSDSPDAYESLLNDISIITKASRKTIIKWATGKHKPRLNRQRMIASLLESEPSVLFP